MSAKITYNAPVVLTFTVLAAAVMMASSLTGGAFASKFFAVYPPFSAGQPLNWFRLVSHVAGHADWGHLMGNFAFILLLGPSLEEKYGSLNLLEMILITGLATGLTVTFLFSSGLLGASGVVFMFIVLSSFTNVRQGEIPLTFILVALLFVGKEVVSAFQEDQVSQLAHIVGGVCGSAFGYFRTHKKSLEPEADKLAPVG